MNAESSEFIPSNELEKHLVQAQKGELEMDQLIHQLFTNQVVILLDEAPETDVWDDSLAPLILGNPAGDRALAVFSSPDRAIPVSQQTQTFEHALLVDFASILNGVPSDAGLVINPAWSVGFEIPAQGVVELREVVGEFGSD